MSGADALPMQRPKLAMVAAMDRNRAIGLRGDLPWHLPDDLRHFKQITLNRPILMGRKTYESIGRPLPKRRNLVLTRDQQWAARGVERVASLADALRLCAGSEWLMVIGGGEIYSLALARAQRLYLCEVDAEIAGADTWFPEYDRDCWSEVDSSAHAADSEHAYAYTQRVLDRKAD